MLEYIILKNFFEVKMSNFIDNKFYKLIDEFEKKDIYSLYLNMVNKFTHIPSITQVSLQKYFEKYPYWGKLIIAENNYEIFYQKAKVFKENYSQFVWLYKQLKDYKSKYILYAILNNFYNFDFDNLKSATDTIYKQYFDLDLLPKCKNEVIVDIGAYVGDTIINYIDSYSQESYNKIYCYEITPNILQIAEGNLANFDNIVYKNKAVSDINGILHFDTNSYSASANNISENGTHEVESVTLDSDIPEKISIIKMDIEGAEKQAILGSKTHIKNDTPKMFLSVYHNNTDLFEIPKLVYSINKNYDYYLRYYGGCIYPTEIVLICLPK